MAEASDPFEAFDPVQPPPADSRIVLVTLAYENTGEGRFFIEPFGIALRDVDGCLWSSTSVARPDESEIVPDLARTPLARGESLSGVVGFAVPSGTELQGVYAVPTGGQLVLLAGFRSGAAYAAAEREPVATPAAVPDDATTAALSDACVDLGQWPETAHDRIEQMHGIDPEDVTLEDAATLAQQAPQFAALVEALHSLEAAGERLEQVETELARIGKACGLPEERHS